MHCIERVVYSIIEEETLPHSETNTWITPMYLFLEQGEIVQDEVKAMKLRRVTTTYLIIERDLYKKEYSTPY